MRADRNNYFGYNLNSGREITQLGISSTAAAKHKQLSHHDKAMTTETRQSSQGGQKHTQEASGKQPTVSEDKAKAASNNSASFDAKGNKELTEPYKLNNKKPSGKTVTFEDQFIFEKEPTVYEDKPQAARNVDSSSIDGNGSRGLTEPYKLNNKKTSEKIVKFEDLFIFEKQPTVYKDKAQAARKVDSSSIDTNGNKGLTEPCKLNTRKTSGKIVKFEDQFIFEKQPMVHKYKSPGTLNLDSASGGTNENQGSTEPSKVKTIKTSSKTVSFGNPAKSDKKENPTLQFPQKFVVVTEGENIVDTQLLKDAANGGPNIKEDAAFFKAVENGTVDADNERVRKSIKEATIVKDLMDAPVMSDSSEASKKKNNADSETKGNTKKLEVNKESEKEGKKVKKPTDLAKKNEAYSVKNEKVDENSARPQYPGPEFLQSVPAEDLNRKIISKNENSTKSVDLARIEEERLAKKNEAYSVKNEKVDENSARPRSSGPDFLQSVPAEDLNRKIIAKNENFTKSVDLARIEEERMIPNPAIPQIRSPNLEILQPAPTLNLDLTNVEVDGNSTESGYTANSLEEEIEKPNAEQPRPRSPYPDHLHTVPEVLSSAAKSLSPVPETPTTETNGTPKSDKTNPVDKKPLNSGLRLITCNYSDPPDPSTPIHSSLYATNGSSKGDETYSIEEKPGNSSLRLIPCDLPDSSASEASDNDGVTELIEIRIIPDDLKPVPTIPIPSKNGKSSKRMAEILASIPNPFKKRSKSYSPKSKVETDVDIKNMTELQSPKPTNHSIYKLAYNESITDSSSTHSRSLSQSPVDREKLIPRNTFHDEIVVYEADSDSEPGSEDLELLPHRYDCETFQNRENNLYINKLSLAVELIRTQEELPYDDQFKRIVEDDPETQIEIIGEENLGFEAETSGWLAGNEAANLPRNIIVTSPPARSDSLATTGVTSTAVDIFTDSCEEAGTGRSPMPTLARNMTAETRAINRRFRGHMRHYLSSRAFGNPCLCCIIM